MSTRTRSGDDGSVVVKYVGSDPCCIYGDPLNVKQNITFIKGVPTTVPKTVAEWAMGMNASLQATVFETVRGGDE